MFAFWAALLCLYALGSVRVVRGQGSKETRFVCTAIPVGKSPNCPISPMTSQSTGAEEEDFKNTVLELRETILQQKETIVNQLGTIKELTSKLSRCESTSEYRGQGTWRKDNKNTMGDLPRDPSDTIDHLGKTMQGLKHRLENLEVRDKGHSLKK